MEILFLSLAGIIVVAMFLSIHTGAGRNEPPPNGSRPPRDGWTSGEESTRRAWIDDIDKFESRVINYAAEMKIHHNKVRRGVMDIMLTGIPEKEAWEIIEIFRRSNFRGMDFETYVRQVVRVYKIAAGRSSVTKG